MYTSTFTHNCIKHARIGMILKSKYLFCWYPTTQQVNHYPVRPAVGYIFELEGRKVVVSGDTCMCPSLLHHARHANVLVLDVLGCDFLLLAAQKLEAMTFCSPSSEVTLCTVRM